MEEMASQLLSETLRGAPQGALILLLVWYMLKDIKAWIKTVNANLEKLNTSHIEIPIKMAALEKSTGIDHDEIVCIRKELIAVWSKIGNRPGDRAL
jgi:hypothetical protein